MSGWARQTTVLLVKDLKIELRTRYTAGIGIGFGAVSFLLISLISARSEMSLMGYSALFWLTMTFAALMNMPLCFTREEDRGTASTLRLMALPHSVFVAKWLYNAIFTSLIGLLILVLAIWMWDWGSRVNATTIFALALLTVLISLGLTASGTLLSAMVTKAKTRSSLIVVISFPILLPLLIPAAECTERCLSMGSLGISNVVWFAIYLITVLLISLPLFELVWRA